MKIKCNCINLIRKMGLCDTKHAIYSTYRCHEKTHNK